MTVLFATSGAPPSKRRLLVIGFSSDAECMTAAEYRVKNDAKIYYLMITIDISLSRPILGAGRKQGLHSALEKMPIAGARPDMTDRDQNDNAVCYEHEYCAMQNKPLAHG